MQPLTFDELTHESAAFDDRVMESRDLDHFCSSSDWILPAAAALMPPREPFLRRGESGYAALMRARHPGGFTYLEPLEAMWGLACPLVGPEPESLAAELASACAEDAPHDVLILCGLTAGSPLFLSLMWALGPRYDLRLGPSTRRYVADLRGGADAFLARRSANLRGSLRKARRLAADAGITFVAYDHAASAGANGDAGAAATDAGALYERILDVERRSWKGLAGTGILDGAMNGFYRLILGRLLARGTLRLMFGRHEGRDVAYILGAVLGDTYRGLQASFDDGYARFSLGSLAHHHQIEALSMEGVAYYDLGTDVEYKRRWGEPGLETVTLVAVPA